MATSIFQFPNPATPDLGCFVRRKHELEVETGSANIHVEFSPSVDFAPSHHQAYFRVKCGQAAFFERCNVFRTFQFNQFPIGQPDWVLGGDSTPHPSDWLRYPTQAGQAIYWFFGEFRNPVDPVWHPDALVGHIYDIYENGTLSTVQYDDTGGDKDLNDLILEVALVKREPIVLVNADIQLAALQQFEKNVVPKLRKRMK